MTRQLENKIKEHFKFIFSKENLKSLREIPKEGKPITYFVAGTTSLLALTYISLEIYNLFK